MFLVFPVSNPVKPGNYGIAFVCDQYIIGSYPGRVAHFRCCGKKCSPRFSFEEGDICIDGKCQLTPAIGCKPEGKVGQGKKWRHPEPHLPR